MAVIASVDGGNGSSLANLPTPVKLAMIGGGLGLGFLVLQRVRGGGGGDSTEPQQLLPNTAIMLGSLQQTMLETMGLVGKTGADLSLQISGSEDSLSAQMNALTSQTQEGLSLLQGALVSNSDANRSAIQTAFTSQMDALSKLIGDNSNAQMAASAEFSKSVNAGLGGILAAQNAESAALAQLGGNLSLAQQQLADQIANVGSQFGAPKADWNWNYLNGKKLWSTVDNAWFTVSNGTVQYVSYWDTVPGRPFDGDHATQINIPYSLKQYAQGTWQAPNT